jgi:hypothetical protein
VASLEPLGQPLSHTQPTRPNHSPPLYQVASLKPLGQPLAAPSIDASPGSYASRGTPHHQADTTDPRVHSGEKASTADGRPAYTPPVMPLPTGVGEGVASQLAALAAQGKAHETLLRSLVAMMNTQQQQMAQLLHAARNAAAEKERTSPAFPAASVVRMEAPSYSTPTPLPYAGGFPADPPPVAAPMVAAASPASPHPLDHDASVNPDAAARPHGGRLPAKLPDLAAGGSQFPPLRSSGGALAPLVVLGGPQQQRPDPSDDQLVRQLRQEQEALRATSEQQVRWG